MCLTNDEKSVVESFFVYCNFRLTILSMFALLYFVSILFLFVRCLKQMMDVVKAELLGVVWVEKHYNRPHRMILLKTMKQTLLVGCLEVSLTQLSHSEIIFW